MKKTKWPFLANVALLLICICAVASFVILAVGGEPVTRWIPALILSLVFGALAVAGMKMDREQE